VVRTLACAVASSASATIVADVVVDAIVGTVPTVDGVNVHWLCPSGSPRGGTGSLECDPSGATLGTNSERFLFAADPRIFSWQIFGMRAGVRGENSRAGWGIGVGILERS